MTIAQVAKQFDLTPDTLRYYERIGLLPQVHRSRGGIRDYTQDDCRWVQFIHCMRSAGLPIEALISYVTLFHQGAETSEARKNILIEQREQLAQRIANQQAVLARLDHKIERYEQENKIHEAELKR
ncbi:MAG: MerR family transcriptional regulator [Faecalibacterium sp.]